MSVQDLLTKFYDIDNVVTLEINMPDQDWTKTKDQQPRFGWRAFTSKDDLKQHRYDWHKTTSVAVSGTKYPPQKQTFTAVSITKKSFAGSLSNVKPSLKLEFSRLSKKDQPSAAEAQEAEKNKAAILALIGTKDLTLNNSKQDASYVRQPLGYEIFRQGGIPYARCNFAKVIVNGKSLGFYVNLEQEQKPYMQRNFENDKGNLYETEAFGIDLNQSTLDKGLNQEGFSDFEDQKDLRVAAEQIQHGLPAAKQVLDIDQIIRVLAMQTVVKHWDGYPNNTFVYNDKVAVENPTVGDVKLQLIPSGIDAILQADRKFVVKDEGVLSKLVLNDKDAKAQLKATLQRCETIFGNNLAVNLKLVDKMAALLTGHGVDNPDKVASEIAVVNGQLNGVKVGLDALIRDWDMKAV